MKIFLLVILFILYLLNPTNLYSQANFQPGYIVANNNDTLNGMIDYRNWGSFPEFISFKSSSDSIANEYGISDILCFGVANEIYVKAVVDLDLSSYDESALSSSRNPRFIEDTVFIQLLLASEKSLYYFNRRYLKEHFFIKREGEFETLIHKKFHKVGNGIKKIATNERYKNQLNMYLDNCPSIKSKIVDIGYSKKELISLFEEYHNCIQENIDYKTEIEKIQTIIGFYGGVSLTDIKFSGADEFESFIEGKYSMSTNVTMGIFYNLVLPRNQGKWMICNELMYANYQFQWQYVKSSPASFDKTTNNTVGFTYVKINNLVRYRYPVKNMFIFLNAGITNGVAISERNDQSIESSGYTITSKAMENPRKWEQGIVFGVGSIYKNYYCEFRYDIGNGMSGYVYLSSRVNRYSVTLGYGF